MIDTFLNCEDAWGMMDVISKATGKAVGFYRLIMSFRAGGSQVISCLLCSHIHLLIFPFFQINAYMYSPYSPLHFCNKPPPMQAAFNVGGFPLHCNLRLSCAVQYISCVLRLLLQLAFHNFRVFPPETPPACPVPFVSLINTKPAPTCTIS